MGGNHKSQYGILDELQVYHICIIKKYTTKCRKGEQLQIKNDELNIPKTTLFFLYMQNPETKLSKNILHKENTLKKSKPPKRKIRIKQNPNSLKTLNEIIRTHSTTMPTCLAKLNDDPIKNSPRNNKSDSQKRCFREYSKRQLTAALGDIIIHLK